MVTATTALEATHVNVIVTAANGQKFTMIHKMPKPYGIAAGDAMFDLLTLTSNHEGWKVSVEYIKEGK